MVAIGNQAPCCLWVIGTDILWIPTPPPPPAVLSKVEEVVAGKAKDRVKVKVRCGWLFI